MSEALQGITLLETKDGYSWFFIMISWEYEHDETAINRWKDVYNFLKRTDANQEDELRNEILDEGLVALNLIGKRKFIIAGQAKSHKPVQKISSMIALRSAIKVDVFAATNVFELGNINMDLFNIIKDPKTGLLS
jgi:hypothetical protein